MIRPKLFLLAALLVSCPAGQAPAQNTVKTVSDTGVSFGTEKTTNWRVGVIVEATSGPMKAVYVTVPVPSEWPEQSVKVVSEDVTRGVRVRQRDLGGVKQMLVTMPSIPLGRTAKALFTFEVRRREILAPKDPSAFRIPDKLSRELRNFVGNSPYIESRDDKIRTLAREATKDKQSAWEKVEAIYDLVREKIEYREGDIKSTSQALRDGFGDCEELTSVFIAMCRSLKIPARMVWVPDHCYPEFYLEDQEGEGHWIPCQAAGTRAFGSMPEMRPILQKGDNFKVPGKAKPQRYVAEHVSAKPYRGSGRPKVTFVREYAQPQPDT